MADDKVIQDALADAVDNKTTQSRPVVPMQVTVIGTGDGSRLPSGTIATTEGEHQPNVVIKVVTPILMILLRGTKAFVVSIVAILPVGGATGLIPAHDFFDLLWKSAILSTGVGITAALNALIEVLSKLDQKFPTWTA